MINRFDLMHDSLKYFSISILKKSFPIKTTTEYKVWQATGERTYKNVYFWEYFDVNTKKLVYTQNDAYTVCQALFNDWFISMFYRYGQIDISGREIGHWIIFADNFYIFFFYLGFVSRTFTNHRTAREGGGYSINSSLPLPPASQALRR